MTRGSLMAWAYENVVVAVRLSGAGLRRALENGLSMLPKADGRFPHLGGNARDSAA